MPTFTSPRARYVGTAAEDQTSAASGTDARQSDRAFVWPPSEADLDAILVWDTREWREVRLDTGIAAVPLGRLPIEPPGPVTTARTSDGLVRETLGRAPRELVVLEASRPPAPAPKWTSRSLTAVAIALCGLAAATWFEVKTLRARPALADTVPLETFSAPMVSRYPGGTMPLVAAERVRPHALSHMIGQLRPTTSADPQPEASTPVAAVAPATLAPTAASTRSSAVTSTRALPSATTATAGPARIETAAPAALTPLTIAGNAEARGGQPTDVSRMALPTAAIDSSLVPSTLPADAASAALARPDAAESIRAAPLEARDEERNIYQVVQQYERAYEQLDVNAARAIWPSVDARALARAFDGLKEQKLEFSSCRVTVTIGEATVICGGRASYVTRVGDHATRTEPREWTFRLRKIDANWLIAKAEVQ